MMHEILLNTTHFQNNNLMKEKTMMTSNHLVRNMTPSITETDIVQFLTKLTHKEQTNNLHHGFSPTESMLLNQRETEWTKTVFNEEEEKPM